jgi:hypothetical protein
MSAMLIHHHFYIGARTLMERKTIVGGHLTLGRAWEDTLELGGDISWTTYPPGRVVGP